MSGRLIGKRRGLEPHVESGRPRRARLQPRIEDYSTIADAEEAIREAPWRGTIKPRSRPPVRSEGSSVADEDTEELPEGEDSLPSIPQTRGDEESRGGREDEVEISSLVSSPSFPSKKGKSKKGHGTSGAKNCGIRTFGFSRPLFVTLGEK